MVIRTAIAVSNVSLSLSYIERPLRGPRHLREFTPLLLHTLWKTVNVGIVVALLGAAVNSYNYMLTDLATLR